jgi:DNA ligase-associated metallophosphoesterase
MLAGLELIPDLSGALYVPEYKALIISDLHLEHGTSLARRGLHVPPFDTAVTLNLLEQVVVSTHATRLIFLGDSFHDGEGEERLDEEYLSRLRTITNSFETCWITGNHDPQPPQSLGGQGAEMISLGPLTLRHEPRRHLNGAFEIAGHLHPGCSIVQRGRSIRGKCFVGDETRLIMPAFGAYTGGLSVTSKAFDGLLNEKAALAFMIGRAAIHKFTLKRIKSP